VGAGVGMAVGIGVGVGVTDSNTVDARPGVAVGVRPTIPTGVAVGTIAGSGVRVGIVVGNTLGLIASVTYRSATNSTVPNAPLSLSTPPQTMRSPGLALASRVTFVLIAYLPSSFGA